MIYETKLQQIIQLFTESYKTQLKRKQKCN